jgi:hypothetical protein
MKKVFILVLTLALFSCATTTKKQDSKPLFEVLTQQEDGGASIHFFEILSEPNEIIMLQNDPKLKNKISPNDIQTSNFIVMNMGQKATGGYKIEIESIVETDKNIIVTTKEITPESSKISTQEITSPFCVVKINSKKDIIIK